MPIVPEESLSVVCGIDVSLDRSISPWADPGGGGGRVGAVKARVQLHAAPDTEGIEPGNLRKGCCVRPAQEF